LQIAAFQDSPLPLSAQGSALTRIKQGEPFVIHQSGAMPLACEPRSFSDRDFRDALGLFATGVVVVTSTGKAGGDGGNHGGHLGATISSFSSVSLDPPLILFSIGRHSKAFAAWQSIDSFAVNILGEEQSAISTRFARAIADKWDSVETRPGLGGTPLLADALAWIECRSYAKYEGGDHLIVVGQVLSLTARSGAGARPLIFFGGKYRQLDAKPEIPTPSDAEQWLHGW
jgi:flavin reductase (DIM6/NTAB) family NADH-FMN oxidoreductase RutF